MQDLEIKNMFPFLSKFRYLLDEIYLYPNMVVRDIKRLISYGDYIYPCDIIELRSILVDDIIGGGNKCLPLFSLKFAQKYLNKYPIFLVISKDSFNKNEIKSQEGLGVRLFKSEIKISEKLKRIQINEPISINEKKSIFKIVNDTQKKLEVVVQNQIPGISPLNSKLM